MVLLNLPKHSRFNWICMIMYNSCLDFAVEGNIHFSEDLMGQNHPDRGQRSEEENQVNVNQGQGQDDNFVQMDNKDTKRDEGDGILKVIFIIISCPCL